MKVKVSKKEIKDNFNNIITIGYCDAQFLLTYKDADFYSCGVYGWSCDYYKINNNTIISTGYSPIDSKYRNYELTKKYNEKARKIFNNYDLKYEQKKKRIDNLLNKYIIEMLKSEK